MMFTQLAQTVVVICGMLNANVKGNLSNWVVTVVIMLTLVPMFVVLLLFVWDPRFVYEKTRCTAVFLIVRASFCTGWCIACPCQNK